MRCLLVVLLALLCVPAAHAQTKPKPNVLFIAIDDLRDWVGFLKTHPQVKTPQLDRLAARGLRFTRSYCASPVCNPSRTALLSGLRPSTSGVYENGNDWRQIVKPDVVMLPRHFANHGYFVAGAGKIYHEAFRRPTDWDDYHRDGRGDPAPTGDTGVGGITFAPLDCKDEDMQDFAAVTYCLEQLQRKHDKPFFLACGLKKPHMPWNVPRKYFDLYPLDSIVLPKTLPTDLDDVPPAGVRMARPEGDHAAMLASGRWKEAVQAYLAAISFCDAMVGRLLDGLDRSAHRENTIIVLWSDHGWTLGEKQHWRKFALWEEATRAPLLFVVPGVTRPNTVCNRTVDFMHLYPTLADLCGLPIPAHLEGKSLRPLLAKPDAPWDLPAITTYRFNNHTVRTDKWRYIRYANGDEELYDETKDPLEWTNLAQRPEHAAVKADLTRWLPKLNVPDPASPATGKGKGKGKLRPTQ